MPETKEVKPVAAEAKTSAKKAAPAKKPAAKKVVKTEKKPAAKKAVKTEKKPAAKKAPKQSLPVLDQLTTLIWKKLEKKDVSKIEQAIAIQVNVNNVGTFYIAVNADDNEKKQVIQAEYYLNDAVIETSAEEIRKIAAGGYKYLDAVKSGALVYRGNLAKGIVIAGLLD